MIWPRFAFVSAPTEDAEVLADLSVGRDDVYVDADSFTPSGPQYMGDVDAVAPQLGKQNLPLDVIVRGSRARAEQLSRSLALTLTKPRGWLMYQFQPDSEMVWFHTYSTAGVFPQIQQVRGTGSDGVISGWWRLPLNIPADPDIRGAVETLASSVTVTNNPASGGCFLSLPDIKGDLPAPLLARWVGPTGSGFRSSKALMQVSDAGGPSTAAVTTFQATTTGAAVSSDARFWLAGSYRPVTYAATTPASLCFTGLTTLAADRRYRVLLRMGPSATGTGSASYRLTTNLVRGSTVLSSATVTASTGTGVRWVDLGVVTSPDLTFTDNSYVIELFGAKVSGGAGSKVLGLDNRFLLIPVGGDDVNCSTSIVTSASELGHGPWQLDGDNQVAAAGLVTGGSTLPMPTPGLVGGWPTVFPGAANGVTILPYNYDFAGSGAADDDLTLSHRLTLSYAPRYLILPGS